MKSALAAIALLIALAGCAHASGSASRTLRVAITIEPKTLNPLLAANTVDGFVWRLMFEPLIAADSHGRPVPMLAERVPTMENGGISHDGLTINYHLRAHLRWTDGAPVTSQDVRWTWQAIMNPANNIPSRHGYDDVRAIDTPDARTAVIHLRRPFAPFVDTFFSESDQPFAPLPAHVLSRYADINRIPFNAAPNVSDGPFRFVRWEHGDRVVLAANDAFFFGKPKLAGVDVIAIPDENSAVNALRTGAVDYLMIPSIATYPQLRNMPNVTTRITSVNGYESLSFNLRRAPMNDPRFRRAIAYAIDKQRLVRDLTFGQARVATADLPDWMWANNPRLAPDPYDPKKARALLAGARIRTPLSLQLVTDSGNVTHEREAVLIQSMLHEIGVEVQIKTYPGGQLYAPAGEGGILNSGKFDLALWPWVGGIDPDNSSQFLCASAPPNGWNISTYCNREMDALQTTALTEYAIPARASAYHRIEALLARDQPIIVFWWRPQPEAIRTNFHAFAPSPTSEAWNAWQWSL
jgi:peptide/nickel transport system substrate-binding protein